MLNKTCVQYMEGVIRRLDEEFRDLCCSANIGRRVGCRWLRGAELVARIGGERDAQVFFVQKFETGHVVDLRQTREYYSRPENK